MKSLSSPILAGIFLLSVACIGAQAESPEPRHAEESETAAMRPADSEAVGGGDLRVVDGDLGVQSFPLKHTEVRAEIVGNVARVEVTQTFQNPYHRKIEAVYVFPLPNRAAVDDMTFSPRPGFRPSIGAPAETKI